MVKYYRCRHWPFVTHEVELHPKEISHSVVCRPRTSDAAALWGAFGDKFHRPPVKLPPGAVILDLGANAGYTAVDFANLFPTARVIAVELDADNARIARRNLERFGARCVVIQAAVWLHEGVVRYEGDEEWAFHVSTSTIPNPDAPTAPSVTIPKLLDELEVDRVNYLKMDVEGAEEALISESATWLDRIDSLKIEVHPPASVSTCASILAERGFGVSTDEKQDATLIATRS